jgi:hypothetical protein
MVRRIATCTVCPTRTLIYSILQYAYMKCFNERFAIGYRLGFRGAEIAEQEELPEPVCRPWNPKRFVFHPSQADHTGPGCDQVSKHRSMLGGWSSRTKEQRDYFEIHIRSFRESPTSTSLSGVYASRHVDGVVQGVTCGEIILLMPDPAKRLHWEENDLFIVRPDATSHGLTGVRLRLGFWLRNSWEDETCKPVYLSRYSSEQAAFSMIRATFLWHPKSKARALWKWAIHMVQRELLPPNSIIGSFLRERRHMRQQLWPRADYPQSSDGGDFRFWTWFKKYHLDRRRLSW